MKRSFYQKWSRLLFVLAGLFMMLFVFRLVYGYSTTSNGVTPNAQLSSEILNRINATRNYASKKYQANNNAPVSVDQKYEKIADVQTQSSEFEEEEKVVRAEIQQNNALVQFEQKTGNTGRRRLHLIIGVPPDNFEKLYERLIKIGRVQSKQITKKDKTNEYKELNAKKASLEKIRNSLLDLKSKGGKIEEFINLENRILDIESQLQELGVNLGDFDAENEFCTVKFSLNEGQQVQISFVHRVKVALEWTMEFYLFLMGGLFFASLLAFVLLLIIEKLKILEKVVR